ncbi:MAG: EF2563 family selenium-dependent molybdenum hydroxylase system protein, partial [Proteobacteria bacterium]|nr:EF2563 family selenium-dependent molybdenum hydroxylase system protein [Pseudomonadota bacterium]
GAGDLSTGVAVRLFKAGFRRILMLETKIPMAVRRRVAFSEAVYIRKKTVENIQAVSIDETGQIDDAWQNRTIPVLVDPKARVLGQMDFAVLVDAVIAKRNLGTSILDANLVIGMGPGFTAGKDVHCVIETQRGPDLGRIIRNGSASPNTGIPGRVQGFDVQRVLRSPADGIFISSRKIGHSICKDDIVGEVAGQAVYSRMDGVLRGLLRNDTSVRQGTKLGDIDPERDNLELDSISDKAGVLGDAVLKTVLETFLNESMVNDHGSR